MIIDDYVARVLEYWRLLSIYIYFHFSHLPAHRELLLFFFPQNFTGL